MQPSSQTLLRSPFRLAGSAEFDTQPVVLNEVANIVRWNPREEEEEAGEVEVGDVGPDAAVPVD